MKARRLLHLLTLTAGITCLGLGAASTPTLAAASQPSATSTCAPNNVALQSEVDKNGYRIQPGDRLEIFVRQETSMQRHVMVLPDGTISLPLLGIVPVFNKTVQDVELSICQNLVSRNLIQDPNVTVSVEQLGGNIFYVIGKVARPGLFDLRHDMDVIRGLAVAGGLATFAKEGEIRILRRETGGSKEFKFDYGKFMSGHDRETNILLRPGDVIVVP
jgi:polysaccharide biosynthesis/export protein